MTPTKAFERVCWYAAGLADGRWSPPRYGGHPERGVPGAVLLSQPEDVREALARLTSASIATLPHGQIWYWVGPKPTLATHVGGVEKLRAFDEKLALRAAHPHRSRIWR